MELFLLAFALAMDSVALSIASGAKCKDINAAGALKIALVFGFFQALMPFLGYFLGLAFVNFIASVDHFVAFAILAFLGFKMIKEARELKENEACLTDLWRPAPRGVSPTRRARWPGSGRCASRRA